MTMDLSNSGFFKAYLRSLSDKQLQALEEWNTTRVAENPSCHPDAVSKKRMIWQERKTRDNPRG